MLKELDSYDWEEVFGEGGGCNCTPITPNRAPIDTTTSPATFSREDVESIAGQVEGESDGPDCHVGTDWVVYGRLRDGRWFVARGGCDYSGWGCQASNSGDVASSQDDIIRFGMSDGERERFGLAILQVLGTGPTGWRSA